MISRYNAWLDGIALSEVSPAVYITDIAYQTITPSIQSTDRAGHDGQYSSPGDTISQNKVSISFTAREYSTVKRQALVQDVIKWAAKGGWLETSDRFDQRMYVRCTKLPAVASVMRWTDNLSVEFTAYDYPFWVDKTPTEVTLGVEDEDTLYLTGTRKSYVEAVITAEETMTEFGIVCGDTSIHLEGLQIASGDVVSISYTDDHHLLDISCNSVSLLDKRDPTSSDDLIAEVGGNAVAFASDAASALCTLMVRGVYV